MKKKPLSYLEQELKEFNERFKESRKRSTPTKNGGVKGNKKFGNNPTLREIIKQAKESYQEEQEEKSKK